MLILAFLTDCASLSREECLYGDWFTVGVRDGRAGYLASQVVQHQEACREYGVVPDKAQYLAGREQGLQQYCQLENAVDTGLRCYRYESVCPAEIDAAFRHYNEVAYQVYQHKEALKSLDNTLFSKENMLTDKKLSDKKRQVVRNEIRELDYKRQQEREELYAAEQQLDRLMEQNRHH